MNSCCTLLGDTRLRGADLAEALETAHPNFGCEAMSCSEHSPGVVHDDEVVGFLLIDPLHYDHESGTVLPAAFEQLCRNDLSTIRKVHATPEEVDGVREKLIRLGQNRTPPQERKIELVLTGKVSDLRAQQHEGRRVLGVLDTALEDNRGHASIFSDTLSYSNKPHRLRVRNMVHGVLAGQRCAYEDFRAGLAETVTEKGEQ